MAHRRSRRRTRPSTVEGQHYLMSIISEVDGGIIGYAIGIDHANEIVDALKGTKS